MGVSIKKVILFEIMINFYIYVEKIIKSLKQLLWRYFYIKN
jgi:hypothetical protein